MLNISRKEKNKLIKAYKNLCERIIRDTDTTLTLEERKAAGQKLLDDLYARAFTNLDIPENEQPALKKELEEIIRKECPDLLSDTPLEFTKQRGFQRKKT